MKNERIGCLFLSNRIKKIRIKIYSFLGSHVKFLHQQKVHPARKNNANEKHALEYLTQIWSGTFNNYKLNLYKILIRK